MRKILTGAVAALALSLTLTVSAEAQLGSTGVLSAYYTGNPDCATVDFGFSACAGAFSGNNSGAGSGPNPGETRVIDFINATWLTGTMAIWSIFGAWCMTVKNYCPILLKL